MATQSNNKTADVVVRGDVHSFKQEVVAGRHQLSADEPQSACEECETKDGMLDRIDVEVELTGSLSAEQHAKLMEIAGKCPVHRTLTSEINIRLRPAQKSPAS